MSNGSQIYQTTFANGLTLVYEAMPWLPSVSFDMLAPLGAVSDPEGQEGSSALLYEWLNRGAGERDSRALSDALDALGVRRGGGSGSENAGFSGSCLAETFPRVLALYADMLRRPRLEDHEFETSRALALQELASLDDNPTQRLFIALSRRFFAPPHGRSSYGTEAGLQALTPEGVRTDFARRAAPRDTIITVAGGLEWEQVRAQVEACFGDWQQPGITRPAVALNAPGSEHLMAETAQTQIGVAFESVAPGAPEWYLHALATAVLSGGMGSRLFTEVREKRGLVYSVAAVNRAVKGFGYTLAYAGTTPERAAETLEVLLAELRRLHHGVSQDELERARTGLLSELVMQGESSGARARSLARDTFLLGQPRPIDMIKEQLTRCTLEDVNRFLAARPEPRMTLLTLGPKAPQLHV